LSFPRRVSEEKRLATRCGIGNGKRDRTIHVLLGIALYIDAVVVGTIVVVAVVRVICVLLLLRLPLLLLLAFHLSARTILLVLLRFLVECRLL
jgi:hypothetical protein